MYEILVGDEQKQGRIVAKIQLKHVGLLMTICLHFCGIIHTFIFVGSTKLDEVW